MHIVDFIGKGFKILANQVIRTETESAGGVEPGNLIFSGLGL